MIEDWIVWMAGGVAIIIVVVVAFLKLKASERRMYENTHKLRVYTDLLNAITELNLAGGMRTRWISPSGTWRSP